MNLLSLLAASLLLLSLILGFDVDANPEDPGSSPAAVDAPEAHHPNGSRFATAAAWLEEGLAE